MLGRILIADDEPLIRMDVREILTEAGFEVVGEAEDGIDAVELARKLSPDIVLMDVKMPIMDGITAAKMIHGNDPNVAVILVTAYDDAQIVEKAVQYGVIGYIVKPISDRALIPAVRVAAAKSREIKQLRKDLDDEKRKLEDRKVIERAKGILIERQGMDEQEAYTYMRSVAMNKRVSIRVVAEGIIESSI